MPNVQGVLAAVWPRYTEGPERIELKRLLVVVATIAAVSVAVTPAAARIAPELPSGQDLCADPTEPLGYVCTVQHSDFKWFPAGTEVQYVSQDGNVVQAMIGIHNGTTERRLRVEQ